MIDRKKEFILIYESAFACFVNDAITIGWILAAFYFNHRFMDSNNFLDALLFVAFFISVGAKVVSKATGIAKIMTPDEAREWLKENANDS